MRRLSIVSAILASATVAVALVVFATDPAAFSPSSVGLITIGFLTSAVVLVAGFLLVRAPWGRWGLAGIAGAAVLLASASTSPAIYVVYALGAMSIVALVGPWVRFWVRQQPVPNAVNATAVALSSVAPIGPIIVGLSAHDTSHWSHWLAALAGAGTSFIYSRGAPGALWIMRILIPATSAFAVWKSPMPSSLILAAGAAAVTVLAWSPAASEATSGPTPPLPPARTQRKKQADAPE